MLVRSILGRLTADAAKTSAHDFSNFARLARLAHRAPLLRCGSCSSTFHVTANGSISRSYATATASKSKKAAPKKSPAKTSLTKTSSAKAKPKTATKKGTTVKKPAKKAVKKAVKKPATHKARPLSEKAKEKKEKSKAHQKLKDLRVQALLGEEPSQKPTTAWMLVQAGNAQKGVSASALAKEAATKYHSLSVSERERYNHTANENKAANEASYNAWVESHSAEKIRLANLARAHLRRLRSEKAGKRKDSPKPIRDQRAVKLPRTAFIYFFTERYQTGDFKGIAVTEAIKQSAQEYKALSSNEKKKYEDLSQQDRKRYASEYEKTYGHPPAFAAAA